MKTESPSDELVSLGETLVRLTPDIVDFKVGLFRSRSRLGRFGQSVGSYYLPGDTTSLRHPIRSGVYQTLTPGGSNNRLGRRIGSGTTDRIVHCPSGFQHGGRFANRNFSNCGTRIFEAVDDTQNVTNATIRALRDTVDVANPQDQIPNAPRGTVREIANNLNPNSAIQIIRNANIPKIGAKDSPKLQSSLGSAAGRVLSDNNLSTLLVRRDGVTLKPTFDLADFSKAKNSLDVENGVLVSRLPDITSVGKHEIPALLGSKLDGVSFALPGGSRFDIMKTRELSASDARRLTGVFNRSAASNDALSALNDVVDASNGALSYGGRFPGITRPYERIVVENGKGQQRVVPRWVFQIFLASSAPQRGNNESWQTVASPVKKKSLQDNDVKTSSKQALIEYKTALFISENEMATFAFQVKRVAAVWDDTLPGDGGWRCPPGTRYGGRITDRFGRNCGWNISRRLANSLEELGRNIGRGLDNRRDRRAARAVARGERGIARQERRVARAENRLERATERLRALRGPGDVVEGRRGAMATRRRLGRAEQRIARRADRANRLDQFAERILGGRGPNRKRNRTAKLTNEERDNLVEMVDMLPMDDPRRQRAIDRLRAGGFEPSASRLNRTKNPMFAGESDKRLLEMVGELDKTNPRRGEVINELRDRGIDPLPGWEPASGLLPETRRERRLRRREDRANRLDRFADRVDGGYGRDRAAQRAAARQARQQRRRQRRGERADRLNRFADRIDGGYGRDRAAQRAAARQARQQRRRQRRGERADRLNRFADRIDGGYGRGRAEERRRRREERRRRRADRLDRFADRVDGGYGRRNEARGETAERRVTPTERPRPEGVRAAKRATEADVNNVRSQFNDVGLPDRPYWREGSSTAANRELARKFDKYYTEDGSLNALGNEINQRLTVERNKRLAMERNAGQKYAPVVVGEDFTPSKPIDEKWAPKERSEELARWRAVNATNEKALADEIARVDEQLKDSTLSADERRVLTEHRDIVADDLSVVHGKGPELTDAEKRLETKNRYDSAYAASRENTRELQQHIDEINTRLADRTIGPKERAELQRQKTKFKTRHTVLRRRNEERQRRERIERVDSTYGPRFEAVRDSKDGLEALRSDIRGAGLVSEDRNRLITKIDQRIAELDRHDAERSTRIEAEKAAGVIDPFVGGPEAIHAKRTAEKRESRRKVLGSYFTKRYGSEDSPWKDPSKNYDTTELNTIARQAIGGDTAARDKINEWVDRVYKHDEILGSEGWKYRTTNIRTGVFVGDEISVSGEIEAFNPASDSWEQVGKFTRYVMPVSKKIKNSYMMMGRDAGFTSPFAEQSKAHGFASVFNGHAFTWAKSAGFEKVDVSAASDGTYVWGRIGFTDDSRAGRRSMSSAMQHEVTNFRNAIAEGREPRGLIKTEEDAAVAAELVRKSLEANFDPATAPTHADFILAISNNETEKAARKAREAEIKNWFQANASFYAGSLDLTDSRYAFDDPRISPDVATAIATPDVTPEPPTPMEFNGVAIDGEKSPSMADLSRMTVIPGPLGSRGGQLGSRGGQWYRHEESGRIFLAKPVGSKAHAENEVAMAAAYRALGVPVPKVTYSVDDAGNHHVISEKVDLRSVTSIPLEDLHQKAKKHMHADMLLSNWNVYGFGGGGGDNVGITPDGVLTRIDLGGAGAFHSRGGTRDTWEPYGAWTDPATMVTSEQGRELYGTVTNEDMRKAVREAASVNVNAVTQKMRDAGVSEETISSIKDVLNHRVQIAREIHEYFATAHAEVFGEPRYEEWKKLPVAVVDRSIFPADLPSLEPVISTPREGAEAPSLVTLAGTYRVASIAAHPSSIATINDSIAAHAAMGRSSEEVVRLAFASPEVKELRSTMVDLLKSGGTDEASAKYAVDQHVKSALEVAASWDEKTKNGTVTAAELENRIRNFQKLKDEGRVAMMRSFPHFLKIVDSERFKTQHETGTSEGMLDPDMRLEWEAKLFAMPRTRPVELSPVYGFIDHPALGVGSEAAYGDIKFTFKDSIRGRTFVTGTDSLGWRTVPCIPSPLTGPTPASTLSDTPYGRVGLTYGVTAYMEAQMLGGVSLSDVESVTIPSLYRSYPEMAGAIAKLETLGITINWTSP